MENNGQPPIKQQLIEVLRGAESLVITTSKNPSRDEIAAAIGLHLLLEKLDKVAEVVITGSMPEELKFLPADFVHDKLQGQRDFVVEVDQSNTEADHLKYVTEDGKLKIYITPYNGVYSPDDVNFSYGDYHCDAIIGLGVNDVGQLADVVTKEQKLTQNAKFLFITNGPGSGNNLVWSDVGASSICEMVMSMSEALGSGMLDAAIATSLFTGIVDKTNHFTNSATTPKVMTMAAQLLAAGANQSEVVKRLSAPAQPAQKPVKSADTEEAKKAEAPKPQPKPQPERPSNEFQIRKNKPASEDRSTTSAPLEKKSTSDQPVPPPAQQPETSQAPASNHPAAVKADDNLSGTQSEQNKTQPPTQPTNGAGPGSGQGGGSFSPASTETIGGTINTPPQAQTPPTPQPPTSQQPPPQAQPPHKDVEIDASGSPKEKVIQPPAKDEPQAGEPSARDILMETINSGDTGGQQDQDSNNASTPAPQQPTPTQPPQQPPVVQPPPQPAPGQDRPEPGSEDALEAARRAVEEAHGGGGDNSNGSNPNSPQQN